MNKRIPYTFKNCAYCKKSGIDVDYQDEGDSITFKCKKVGTLCEDFEPHITQEDVDLIKEIYGTDYSKYITVKEGNNE